MGIFSEFFRQLLSKKDKRNNAKPGAASAKKRSINTKNNFSSNKIFSAGSKSSSSGMDVKSTASTNLSSSLQQKTSSKEGKSFKYNEDGRRYHGNDKVAYVMPNDDDEADRLHGQHWVLRYILQRNYHAPVTKLLEAGGAEVLDSGCGPATWTFEMAETYTSSKFYGVDISFVFPETIRPANVDLVIGNIAKHIPYPDNKFDYIHQRLLMVGLTSQDWDNTLKELYRTLKPGGYVELAEFSAGYIENTGPLWRKLQDATANIFKSKGIPTRISAELQDRLTKAGFVNVKLEITPLPINHDGKRGELLWNDLKHGYLNIRPALVKANPEFNDPEVYAQFIEHCGKETKEYGTCTHWYACYAQKPLEE